MAVDVLPPLESLELLVSVARTGSLGKAAAAQRISQPSASLRIKRLEALLGLQLLVRSPTGSNLTPAGRLVAEWSGKVLSDVDHLVTGVAALQRRGEGALTVAASLTIAEYLMPQWLTKLQEGDSDVVVQLDVANSTTVIRRVREDVVPLGFIESRTVPSDMASATVGEDRLCVVVSPDHPWAASGRAVTPQELLDTPLILREEGSGTRETIEAALSPFGLIAPPALQLSTTAAVRGAALAGAGPAVLSELAVKWSVSAGLLVEVPVEGLNLRRDLYVIVRRGTRLSGVARRLAELASGGVVP